MKKRMSWALALVAGLLAGCIQVEDELTLQADGSGTVRIKTSTSRSTDMVNLFDMSEGEGGIYPPVNEAEAKYYFPAKDFTVSVEEQHEGERKIVVIAAAFKDANALMASPYGRAHQLMLRTTNGTLYFKAHSGFETVARCTEIKPEGELASLPLPGADELQKAKNEMKFSFRVTLPANATEANGTREGKTVVWTTERSKCKDADEFVAKAGDGLEAQCSADGLKFAPTPPPRLGLGDFKDLAVGAVASTVALPDTNQVAAAVRFEPQWLSVTRSLDLSGEGSQSPSLARLHGAVVVPVALAPQRWGAAQLLEAVDAKGKDLVPKEDSNAAQMMRINDYSERMDDGDASANTTNAAPSEQRQPVDLTFNAPEWKVKEIARIKGSVALQYLGGMEVLKVSNAVPASLIQEDTHRTYSSSDEQRLISDPRLEALGLALHVEMAMRQSGMTMLSLGATGNNATIADLQVFDADGKPWPTIFRSENSFTTERSFQVSIPGKPKAPLSLGLIVSGVGASVEVPFTVEKVPVINN